MGGGAAFSAGAAAGWVHPFGREAAALTSMALLIVLRRRPFVSAMGLVALAAAGGWWCASIRAGANPPARVLAERHPYCRLVAVVKDGGWTGRLLDVRRLSCPGVGASGRAGLVAGEVRAEPGAVLAGRALLVPLGDDRLSEARRRLGAAAVLEGAELHLLSPPRGVWAAAAAIRAGLRRTFAGHGEAGALLRGLTIGDTSSMSRATLDSFRAAGLSHVVAVSGSNLAIVAAALGFLVRGLPARARVLSVTGALAAFVMVAGPDASVLRAAAMAAVGMAALFFGRAARPLNALAVALIGLIALRPGLATSVGLWLSASATAGIVLFSETVARRLWRPRALTDALAVSLAAQGAVLPILVSVFGSVSLVSPAANLLAAPAVAPATVTGLAAGVVGAVSPQAAAPLGWVAASCAAWVLEMGQRFGSPAWAAAEVPKIAACPLGAALLALATVILLRERAEEGP